MKGVFDFLLYYSVYLGICACLYRALIQGKYHPSLCRRLILDILCFSVLTVPLCRFTDVSEFNLTVAPALVSKIIAVYVSGVVVFSILFGINLFRLRKIKGNSVPFLIDGKEVFLHSDHRLGCFSWFRYIFLPEEIRERTSDEQNIILSHEGAHLYLFHWLDLVGINIFLIFQWYNPAIWYFRKELRQIHEYEADQRVLDNKAIGRRTYETFLVDESSRRQGAMLASNLSYSSLKSRILMMNKEDLKNNIMERSSLIFAFAAAMICLL